MRRLVTLGVFVLLLAAGCGDADRSAQPLSSATLQPIPFPDLGQLEEKSRQQIEEMHEQLERLGETHTGGTLLAKAYGELGKLYNAHLFEEAAAVCYRNAELLAPQDYRWTYYRAHLFRRAGEEAIAIRGFERAIELMKQDVTTDPRQFVAALTWLGTLHQAQGDNEQATLMYEQAIRINPGAVLARISMAQIAAADGDHATAIGILESLLPGQPRNSPTHNLIRYQLAQSYRAAGERARAAALLEGVETGSPLSVRDPLLQEMQASAITSSGFVRRGSVMLQNGRVGAAMALFRKALEIDPESYFAHLHLATALVQTGAPEQALEHVERATELMPESGLVWGRLSRLLRRQGQLEQALSALETARRLEPENVDLEIDYAQILLEDFNRADEALGHFEDVLELEPANPRALGGRAAALGRIDGCEASLASFEEAHALLPGSHVLADGLARTLLVCGDDEPSRVLALARQAFEAAPTSRYADTLARASAAAGDFEGAVREQERAIELARRAGLDTQKLETVLRDYYRQGRRWQPLGQTLDDPG